MRQLCETEIVASKEFIVDAKPMTHSFLTPGNYFLIETCPLKIRKNWILDVRSAKRKKKYCVSYDPSLSSAVSELHEKGVKEKAFSATSLFRIAGRENLAVHRRDLLDACRATLRDLLPTLARFKSRSRAVFAKFITSHWDFSTAVDAAKSLLWKVHSKRRFTRGEAENLSR